MDELKKERKINYKQILYIIFVIYLLMLVKIILFKTNSFTDLLKGNISAGYRSANLIPFQTITNFIKMKDFSSLRAFSNTVGNIAVFLPLGYLLPILTRKINNLYKVFIVSISISILFESLQYVFYLGTLDIDDVILNTTGGVIGYIIYYFIKKLMKTRKSTYIASVILSFIAFIIAYPIAKIEFGNLLGISNYEIIYTNEDVIPKSEPDIRGTYISKEDDNLMIYNTIVSKDSNEIDLLNESTVEISDNGKFFYTKITESKNKSEIEYIPITYDEIQEIKEYSLISIWNNSDDIDIILFSDGINSSISTTENKSTNIKENEINSEKLSISGDIKEVSDNSIKINIANTIDMGNGKSISVIGKDDNANYIDIIFDENTEFKLKEEGKSEVDIKSVDIESGNSVDIIYTKNEQGLALAESIMIFKIK